MKERAEFLLANQLRELIVGAEVGGREGRKRGRVERGLFADGGDELSRAIDQERAPRIALLEKPLERLRDRPEVAFGERPSRCASRHESLPRGERAPRRPDNSPERRAGRTGRWGPSHFSARRERLRNRDAVGILEVTAHRDAPGDARHDYRL